MTSKGAWPRKLSWLLCFSHSENPLKSLRKVFINYSSLLFTASTVPPTKSVLCKWLYQASDKVKTWSPSRCKSLLSGVVTIWKGKIRQSVHITLSRKRLILYRIKDLLEKVHVQFTIPSEGVHIMHNLVASLINLYAVLLSLNSF